MSRTFSTMSCTTCASRGKKPALLCVSDLNQNISLQVFPADALVLSVRSRRILFKSKTEFGPKFISLE